MKIVFDRQSIIEAIAPLMCAVSTKSTLPYVEGILIEAQEPDICTLTTFDLEKGVQLTIHTRVLESGSFIINAQKFNQTIKVMEGDTVTLTVNDQLVALFEAGKSSHKMNAFAGSQFPEIPHLNEDHGFVIKQSVLKRMLSKVEHAMGVNDQRPVLNGCYFRIVEDTLMTVACDSFRLAKCATIAEMKNLTEGESLNFSFIVPTKTVGELHRMLLDDDTEEARIIMNRRNIMFRLGDLNFFSRLIDGEYIDFERVILKNHPIKVNIDREQLIMALERAALITEERIAGKTKAHVKLELCEDILKISAVSTAGSTYDEIGIHHEGGDLLIAFTNRFLIDALRAIESECVTLEMSSAMTSINIVPTEKSEDEAELYMLLPVRMRD